MEKVRCTRNIDCFTKGNEYDYPDAINDVGEIRRLKGWSLFDMYFEKIETKEEVKKDQKEEYDLSTTITRAVKNDDPSIIMKETGKSIDELCDLVDENAHSCLTAGYAADCAGLCCQECQFSQENGKTKESAKAWLRGKSKQSLSAYDAVHVDSQEKWDFVSSILGYMWKGRLWSELKEKNCINIRYQGYGVKEQYYNNVVSFEEWLDLTGHYSDWILFKGRKQFSEDQKTVLGYNIHAAHIPNFDEEYELTNDNSNNFESSKKDSTFVSWESESDDYVEYKALPVQHCSRVEFLTNEE